MTSAEDSSNANRERTSNSLTFRLDKDSVDKLRIEAQKQGISLNSLINQILKNFLEWHIFEPKIGFVPILKPVVKELFEKMSKEQIILIAACTGIEEVRNAVYFMKGRIDLDSFLSWFEARMKNSSIHVSHTFNENNKFHTYAVKHDISENWSLYLKQIIEGVFNHILQKNVEVSATQSMLVFRFSKD